MGTGKIIAFEGAMDGAGKTTQINLLKQHLEKDGIEYVAAKFPSYDTWRGRPSERYLKGEFGKPSEVDPVQANTLFAVDRFVAWNEVLKKEYEQGKIILLDRYTTSSLIYQSVYMDEEEKKKFIEKTMYLEYTMLDIPAPDKVIFLTAPFDLIVKEQFGKRKSNDGVKNDIHESDLEYMKRVYFNSQFVSKLLGWERIETSRDGKMRTRQGIHNEIYSKLSGTIK